MNYKEAISIIEQIEGEKEEEREYMIDPSNIEPNLPVRTVSYKEVLAQLPLIKGVEKEVAEEEQKVQQPVAPAPTPQKIKPIKPREVIFSKELSEAAARLSKITNISEVETKIKEAREKRMVKKLVLPTLSINDQISDLEKISEGLDEHVFSKEQLKIIKEEAQGLARLIAEGKQPTTPEDLVGLRNQLLRQVIEKANRYVV